MAPIDTGTTLSRQSYDDCKPVMERCVLVSPASESNTSVTFTVGEEPHQIRAFNMSPGESFTIEQVHGPNEGDHFEDIVINGQPMTIQAPNNYTVIPFTGRFRVRFNGELGEVLIVCETLPCCMADAAARLLWR